jgi:hypothetical protein
MSSGGMIYTPSLTIIGPGIQVILRILPKQREIGCSVGITDERVL